MKVALVDYSGNAYGAGLAKGLSRYVDLYYITRFDDADKSTIYANKKYWFKLYDKNCFCQILKLINYLYAYMRLFFLIKKERIEIVHIQWFPVQRIDIYILKCLKRFNVKIILTAHNVLPHINGEKYIETYKIIYSLVDRIVVHGKCIKNEFLHYYPEYEDKLRIELHGQYFGRSFEICSSSIDRVVQEKISSAKKVAIFFGNMFYNKGVDMLVKHWLKDYKNESSKLLIIVGSKDPNYYELNELEPRLLGQHNIVYKPQIIDEKELNYYISNSDIIVTPYRHASMSGIVFKAVDFLKPLLSTDVGSIGEYIDSSCSYVVKTYCDGFEKTFDNIMNSVSKDDLKRKGELLAKKISKDCSWNSIAPKTIHDAYIN